MSIDYSFFSSRFEDTQSCESTKASVADILHPFPSQSAEQYDKYSRR